MDQESPIDPRLCASPTLSPTTTVTTTIRSTRTPNKLCKKNSGSYSKHTQHVFGAAPSPPRDVPQHNRTRSRSSDSIHSVRPEWWTDDLAPAPLSTRSRTSSLGYTHSHSLSQSRPQSRAPSQPPFDPYAPHHNADPYSHTAVYTDEEASVSDYPGIVGGRPGVIRTESMRSTYLPDGVYEVREGRVRSLSQTGRGRWEARGAGRAG